MYPTFFPVQVIESLVVDVVNLPRGWEQRDRQGGLEIKVGGGELREPGEERAGSKIPATKGKEREPHWTGREPGVQGSGTGKF